MRNANNRAVIAVFPLTFRRSRRATGRRLSGFPDQTEATLHPSLLPL